MSTKRKTTTRPPAKHPHVIADALVERLYHPPDDIAIVYDLMQKADWDRLQRSVGRRVGRATRVKLEGQIRAGLPKALHSTLVEYSDLHTDEAMTAAFAAFVGPRHARRSIGRFGRRASSAS